MLSFIVILIPILKLDQFKYRNLTQGEIQIARKVFAHLIDYKKVKIMNHPYIPWQPTHVFMAPQGYIHVLDIHFKDDFSKENIDYQTIFIHEMAHIFQYQNNMNVLLKGAILQIGKLLSFGLYNPYQYTFEKEKKFLDYNIEQQGDIAKDIFLQKIPNIILCDYYHKIDQ